MIGRAFLLRPGRAHQGKSRGEDEELLENQPFLRLGRLLHVPGLVNGVVGLLRRENSVFRPDGLRQNFRRGIADRQRLQNRLSHRGVGQPRGQGVNGQHPTGGKPRTVRVLENRVGHIVAHKIPGYRAVENIFSAVFQLTGGKAVVEEGHIQPSGGIRQLNLGHIQSLADMGGAGIVHDRGPEAGGNVRRQLRDRDKLRPILVAPGKMADQIPQGKNIQIGKELGFCLPHPLEDGHGIAQTRHGFTALHGFPAYYTAFPSRKQRNSSGFFRQRRFPPTGTCESLFFTLIRHGDAVPPSPKGRQRICRRTSGTSEKRCGIGEKAHFQYLQT